MVNGSKPIGFGIVVTLFCLAGGCPGWEIVVLVPERTEPGGSDPCWGEIIPPGNGTFIN